MASVKSAASSVVHTFLGLYLILWNTMKTIIGGLYSALRTLSGVYPPATHFLSSVENTVHRLRTDPSARAELNLQNLLQEFWTPSTTLEGLVSSVCFFALVYPYALQNAVWTQYVCCRVRFRLLSRSHWPSCAPQVSPRQILCLRPKVYPCA